MRVISRWKSRRRAGQLKKRMSAAAKAFNDLYTYGMHHDGNYRWMCPECNAIHEPTKLSWISGLQYPGCCSSPAGDRLYCDIATDLINANLISAKKQTERNES